jgi:hypothetical protein
MKTKTKKTVGGHGGVKAKNKTGKVVRLGGTGRRRPKPVEMGPITALVVGATETLEALLSSVVEIAGVVYEFMGHVYNSMKEFLTAALNWLSAQASWATGKAKDAYMAARGYIVELVSSQNISVSAVNVLCGAAAIGVAITGGILVGTTIGGVAIAAGAATETAKMVAIMTSAITGGVLAETCYTFFKAGVRAEVIGEARKQALAAA